MKVARIVLLAIAMLVVFSATTNAANQVVKPTAAIKTDLGVTYVIPFASLAAAAADTGFAYFNLKEMQPQLLGAVGFNSSGVPVMTMIVTVRGLVASAADSARIDIGWSADATARTAASTGYWTMTNTFAQDADVLLDETPTITKTVTPSMAGDMRMRCLNKDASTAAALKLFVTFITKRI